jgi:lipopolysaccharide assembly outer membrane protein LptD (OstA)
VKKALFIIRLGILLVISQTAIFSQQTGDSLFFSPIDSLKKTDTTRPTGDIDAIIEYSATDSAIFDISSQKLYLYNQGDLKYKEFELKAARIILFKENSTLESNGIPDTLKPGKLMGTPELYEGSKKYEGETIRYNFKTRKGNIAMGTTELEGGYYLGEKIKKVSKDIYFIQDGRYTTCDKGDPDFYFGSPKMKVIQGDKVIAEPVYLYIDDVPIFAIPFGIFPNHSGRSSGLIPPAYGDDATYGRYLTHLGYFWAVNDYMDLTFQGNYFTKGRVDLNMRYRYALRYKFTGEFNLGGSRVRLGEQKDVDKVFTDDWRIGITHNQTINPTTSLTANVNLLSSKRYYDNSTNNLNDLLLQNAVSNVTLSKTWEGTPNSITLNYYRDQNLQTGEINERLPSVSFTRSQDYPFRGKKTSLLDLKWYEVISYGYSMQFLNSRAKTLLTDANEVQSFNYNNRAGMRHNLSISAPIKVSEFSFSPFINYLEIWYNKSVEKHYDPVSRTVVTNDVSGFKSFRYFSTGVSASSRIIGLFNTDFLKVKGFRHTILPSITYSYTPDFSKLFWNAYKTYPDSAGKEVIYNIFEREVFGGAPSGESQSLGFSVGNVFEMKVKENDTTDNKFQLFNLNAGISYNFAADSLRFSELGLGFRTQVASVLNIGGAASFNLYKYVNGVGRVNQFLWNTDKKFADLTSFNINLSTTIQGSQFTPEDTTAGAEGEEEYIGIYSDKPVNFKIPWSVTFNYNYSLNQAVPSVITKSSNLFAGINFQLTKKWKFTVSTGYDIFNKQITAPYITIYRDLHCWEMNFNWIPTGTYRGFRFELRIKAPQLQDIKVTKQTNYRGVY